MRLQTKIAEALHERCRNLGLKISEEIFVKYDTRVSSWIKKYRKDEPTPEQIGKGDFCTYTNNFSSTIGELLKGRKVKDYMGDKFYKDVIDGITKLRFSLEEVLQAYEEDCEAKLPHHQRITELSIAMSDNPTEQNRTKLLAAIKNSSSNNTFEQSLIPLYFILREQGYSDRDFCS